MLIFILCINLEKFKKVQNTSGRAKVFRRCQGGDTVNKDRPPLPMWFKTRSLVRSSSSSRKGGWFPSLEDSRTVELFTLSHRYVYLIFNLNLNSNSNSNSNSNFNLYSNLSFFCKSVSFLVSNQMRNHVQ